MKKVFYLVKKIQKNPFKLFTFLWRSLMNIIIQIPYFDFIRGTKGIDPKITLGIWFIQKVLRINSEAYWPMHHSSQVTYAKNVLIGKDTNPGYSSGCFIHGVNKIIIGDYTKIAPNVGLMSGNHDIYDLSKQTNNNPMIIGKYCWIGMNAVILPGVVLGDHTVVAANAVVTKSFPEGYCVLAGVPAIVIKKINADQCIQYKSETNYIGYIREDKFEKFKNEKLYL